MNENPTMPMMATMEMIAQTRVINLRFLFEKIIVLEFKGILILQYLCANINKNI